MIGVDDMNTEQLKLDAEKARIEYKRGLINRSEAKQRITPYVDVFNTKSKELAKKYKQRPKLLSLSTYLR